jgi:hypothetical protein
MQAPFLGLAELCLKSCAPFGGTLIPNGEAMLAEHFRTAAAGARTTASLDETARLLWRAHAEAQIPDTEAGAISEAIEARRAALVGKGPAKLPKPALGRPGGVGTSAVRNRTLRSNEA